MNELQLPNNLVSIATKINSYKNNIGYSFIEIGKELIRAKKEDVAHGDWQLFLDEINMSKSQADRHIKISNEYDMGKLPHVGNIGFRAMYEIATLPQEEREKEHETNGQTKTVDEMTVRELQEVKHQNKQLEQAKQQAEQQTEQAKNSEQIMQKQLEESESKKPETVEVIKEVESEDLQRQLRFSQKENERLSEKQEHHKLKDTTNFNEEEAKLEMKKLQSEADRTTIEIRIAFKKLNDRVSVSRYLSDAISCGNDYEKKKMSEEITITENILRDIKTALLGRREIN